MQRPTLGGAGIALGLVLAALANAAPAQEVRRIVPVRPDSSAQSVRAGTVDGIVTDTALTPLLGAQVTVLSTAVRVGTGPNGRFRITDVPSGDYVLIVRRAGYKPTSVVVQVAAGDTMRVAYTLEPEITSLAPVIVAAAPISVRMAEFEARRALGQGQFMGQADIERRPVVYATDLLRGFTSISVSPSNMTSSGGMPEQYAMSRREGGSLIGPSAGYCPLTVVVDRIPMPTPFNLDLLPSPRNLAGIEVYSGPATIPPQFNGFNRGCGLILIWTKDGY